MNLVWQELHLATEPSPGQPADDWKSQCLACQKRGDQCDSTPISCLRCEENNVRCPGYTDAFKKKHLTVYDTPQNGRRRVKPSKSTSPALQLMPSMTQQNKDWMNLQDSIKYYNSTVVPYTKPVHLPYKRQNIQTRYWDIMPEILRCLWIFNVRAMQAGRSATDPLSSSDLVQYRGRSLSELQVMMKNVPEAVKDPSGIALFSILLLMGAEMQISDSSWSTHLEAARKMIGLTGGLSTCFETFLPATHGPFISFMVADIVTATTCPAGLLSRGFVQTQRECLEVLPSIEQDLIASGYSYPLPVLLVMVQTNILRGRLNEMQTNGRTGLSTGVDFETLLSTIQMFDPERWASRVSAFGRARPETVENAVPVAGLICLASLAYCFKSAAILYLVLSTSPNEALAAPQLRQIVHSARYALNQHLRLLFKQGQTGSDMGCDGPLQTQLWKFVGWPLFVSAYVRAAWGAVSPGVDLNFDHVRGIDSHDEAEKDTEHMHAISAALAGRKWSHVEKLVQQIHTSKILSVGKGIEAQWRWDDAFHKRCVFVV